MIRTPIHLPQPPCFGAHYKQDDAVCRSCPVQTNCIPLSKFWDEKTTLRGYAQSRLLDRLDSPSDTEDFDPVRVYADTYRDIFKFLPKAQMLKNRRKFVQAVYAAHRFTIQEKIDFRTYVCTNVTVAGFP